MHYSIAAYPRVYRPFYLLFYLPLYPRLYLPLYLLLGITLFSGTAVANDMDQIAGRMDAEVNGRTVTLSALTSHYDISISGDLATVKLTQEFSNPYNQPLNATYLFPLNQQAAVHAMKMTVGDEIITARIDRTVQARRTFEQAKHKGQAAALLTQYRPNMFTQQVANLMPGNPMQIEIEYTQTIMTIDHAYELVVPLVTGPRFQPAGAGERPKDNLDDSNSVAVDSEADPAIGIEPYGQWELEALPDYPPVVGIDLQDAIDEARVSIAITLESPVPLQQVSSATHALDITTVSDRMRQISFAGGQVVDNRDLVLRYAVAGDTVDSGLLSHFSDQDGGYFSLLIEPPEQVTNDSVLPREMVFLLDCSGSMNGLPMQASKVFMRKALNQLNANDSFRIIRFSDSATEFSNQPLPATPENIQRGLRYTRGLVGGGGTQMTSGIHQALAAAIPEGAVRNVVFLTDGYIGNEVEVLKLVHRHRKEARLYAFGVGAGVNRYLLSELGRVGRGFTRYFDPSQADAQAMETIAGDLAQRLRTPVLTDLSINWNGLEVQEVYPEHLPDLYAGDSIRVSGRYRIPTTGEIVIEGRGAGQQARLHSLVQFEPNAHRPAVRRIWARQAINAKMHELITPQPLRDSGRNDRQLKEDITNLGLNYDLVTRWTAFVAVSRTIVNKEPSTSMDASVALPKVAGVSQLAYAQPAMTGFGAPEPGMLAGLVVGLLTFGWLLRRRNRTVRC